MCRREARKSTNRDENTSKTNKKETDTSPPKSLYFIGFAKLDFTYFTVRN